MLHQIPPGLREEVGITRKEIYLFVNAQKMKCPKTKNKVAIGDQAGTDGLQNSVYLRT